MNILWVFPITMTGLLLGPNVKTPRRFCPQTELQQFASDVSLWAKSEAFDWPQANRCHREHVGNSHQATNRPRDPIDLQQPPVSRSLCEGSKWSPLQSFKLEKMVAPNRSIWRPWAAELQVNWQIGKSCPLEKLLLLPASSAQQRCNVRFFLILNIAVLTKSHLHLHRQSWKTYPTNFWLHMSFWEIQISELQLPYIINDYWDAWQVIGDFLWLITTDDWEKNDLLSKSAVWLRLGLLCDLGSGDHGHHQNHGENVKTWMIAH